MKDYYIIRKAGAPPAITESMEAAQDWEILGCDVVIIQLPELPEEEN